MSEQPTWQERIDAQTEALDRFGFGPAFSVGGSSVFSLATDFATCQTCFAAVVIIADPKAEQPVALHKAWHDREEKP